MGKLLGEDLFSAFLHPYRDKTLFINKSKLRPQPEQNQSTPSFAHKMWSPRIPNNTSSMTTTNINNNQSNHSNNNSTDHLHLLFHQQSQLQQSQQHYLIHLPSLRATPTTPTTTTNTINNNITNNTHSIQQQPTCHVAHDSLPNSIAQMNLLLTTNNNNTILLHNVPIQLLSIIPSTPYAIATYSSSISNNNHDQLFIIDLSNHGQLRQIFKYVFIYDHLLTFSIIVFVLISMTNFFVWCGSIEQVQKGQRFFQCSDFGQIKLGDHDNDDNNSNHNNNYNNHHWSSSSSHFNQQESSSPHNESTNHDHQFVMHGNMFCYYRKRDNQLFGGTLEQQPSQQSNSSGNGNGNGPIFSMTLLFRMKIPPTTTTTTTNFVTTMKNETIVCMFPDSNSQTALITIRKPKKQQDDDQNNLVYCLYLRPMNDVYINIRYELRHVALYQQRPLINRCGETMCYMKSDHETICVMKVGHFMSPSSSSSSSSLGSESSGGGGHNGHCHMQIEYKLRKVLERSKMLSYDSMQATKTEFIDLFLRQNGNSNNSHGHNHHMMKPKKRMKFSQDMQQQQQQYSPPSPPSLSSLSLYSNHAKVQQGYYHTVNLVQSRGTIYCIQQTVSSSSSSSSFPVLLTIRIVNMSTAQILEIPSTTATAALISPLSATTTAATTTNTATIASGGISGTKLNHNHHHHNQAATTMFHPLASLLTDDGDSLFTNDDDDDDHSSMDENHGMNHGYHHQHQHHRLSPTKKFKHQHQQQQQQTAASMLKQRTSAPYHGSGARKRKRLTSAHADYFPDGHF